MELSHLAILLPLLFVAFTIPIHWATLATALFQTTNTIPKTNIMTITLTTTPSSITTGTFISAALTTMLSIWDSSLINQSNVLLSVNPVSQPSNQTNETINTTISFNVSSTMLKRVTINFSAPFPVKRGVVGKVMSSSFIGGTHRFGGNVMTYMNITVSNTILNQVIDRYVRSVQYTFVVPRATFNNTINPNKVVLLKFNDGSWEPLPTLQTGANATDYVFTAISNSLSLYAVSYAAGNASNVGTITLSSGYPTYFYSAASVSDSSSASVTWTVDTNYTQHNKYHGSSHYNQTFIGHSTSNSGTCSGCAISINSIFGIGANVIFAYNSFTATNSQLIAGTSSGNAVIYLTFTVDTSNTFVIILGAGATQATSLPNEGMNLPTGCTLDSNSFTYSPPKTSEATCNSLASGTYTISMTVYGSATEHVPMSLAAYGFAPYTVTLDDSPGSGNILTNGMNQASGNTIYVIGSSSINAIVPSGYSFTSWSVDSANSANVSIASTTSANTFITIEGNAIITATYYKPMSTPTLTASNSVIDVGQVIAFSATAGGGTPPYTYNYMVINTITGSVIANQLYTSISSATNTFVWDPSPSIAGNTVKANVIITDASSTTVNSVYTSTLHVEDTPSLSITPSNSVLDSGQYTTYTITESGGTGIFDTGLYNVTSDLQEGSNVILQLNGENTITLYIYYVGSSVVPMRYNAIATDKGTTTPFVFNSITSTLSVTSALSATVTPTVPVTLDAGQSTTVAADFVKGSSPYTYNFFVFNSVTNVIVANQFGTSGSFILSTTGLAGNTLEANVVLTDGATTPETGSFGPSSLITVNPAMTTPSITTPTPSTQPTGNTLTWTTSFNGGTSSYTYNWNVYNTITGTIIANQLWTGNSYTGNTFSWLIPLADAGNTVYANVIVTDSATTPVTVNSVLSGPITITSASCSFTISNTVINFGTINPGQQLATSGTSWNSIEITNTGSLTSNIYFSGTDWTFGSNSFYVTNTVWSWGSGVSWVSSNNLESAQTDSLVQIVGGANRNVYFGTAVPPGQTGSGGGQYSQTIDIISSC